MNSASAIRSDKWFREEGYEVTPRRTPTKRSRVWPKPSSDAALVDIKMRGTDGMELQRRMHEIDPELIVIIMTGYASVETAVQALKNGAYDYVTKPLDPDEIAHMVNNALCAPARRRGKRPAAGDRRRSRPASRN